MSKHPHLKTYTFGRWTLNRQINAMNPSMWIVFTPDVNLPVTLCMLGRNNDVNRQGKVLNYFIL